MRSGFGVVTGGKILETIEDAVDGARSRRLTGYVGPKTQAGQSSIAGFIQRSPGSPVGAAARCVTYGGLSGALRLMTRPHPGLGGEGGT